MSTAGPNQPHSAPTLSAVAKLAGVSSITVSRVVRLPDLVAPETRGRVEAAMRELGYVPNLVAGSLASAAPVRSACWCRRSRIRSSPIRCRACPTSWSRSAIAVILAQSRYDAAREDHMLAALLSRRPEAIIMVGSPATEDGARLLRRAGIPVVETWDLPAIADRRRRRIRQLCGRRCGRAASGRAGTQEPGFHRRRRSARHAALAWISRMPRWRPARNVRAA